MRKITIPLCIFLLCLANLSYGQFEIGATVRPRTEYRHGFKKLMTNIQEPALFTEQRTRLQINYSQEKYKIGISIQDVRIWGETGQINKTDGLTSFHEAYFEYMFNKKFSLKGGRQEFDYDDARILGNLDWAAQARSFDAFLLKYVDSSWAVHAGFSFNQNATPVEPAKLTDTYYQSPAFGAPGGGLPNPKTLAFLWYTKSLRNFKFSALAMNSGYQMASDSSMSNLFTGGVNPEYKFNKDFSIFGSVYVQTGTDLKKVGTDAWMGSINFKYTGFKNTSLTLGTDYLSGTDRDSKKSTAFEPLFGTNHKFYGNMDYFYVGSASAQAGKTVGLIDIYLKTKFDITKKSSIVADLHQFLSPVTIYETATSNNAISSTLGTEIDLIYNLKLAPAATLSVGYSQMFATNTMEVIKGGNAARTNNWAWVMFTFKPTMFKN